jgi:hypothetical protein
MNEKKYEELLDLVQDSADLLSRVRVVLGTMNIEARHAGDFISADTAIGSIIENLRKALDDSKYGTNMSEEIISGSTD